jgi:hypothetical protein
VSRIRLGVTDTYELFAVKAELLGVVWALTDPKEAKPPASRPTPATREKPNRGRRSIP